MRAVPSLRISTERRGILLHDGLAFMALSAVAIVLYLVTLFLFRSFEGHRHDLGERWAQRGQQALADGHPDDAIYSLRTALSYEPDARADQLLLAEALARGGHVEEATNYFENLWEQTPGDGFINLQLARLARGKKETQPAVNYYRAAIFGSWPGDATARRRDLRLELSDYLTEQHELTAARSELFIAAANNPRDAALSLAVADRLTKTGDLNDALVYADKAVEINPDDAAALTQAGRTAYALGQFAQARHAFERALDATKPDTADAAETLHREQLAAMEDHARRALALTLSRDLPQPDRAAHLALASAIAQGRLNACMVQTMAIAAPAPAQGAEGKLTSSDALPVDIAPDLAPLKARWTVAGTPQARKLLIENADAQDQRVQLIGDTERTTARLCGQPSGDDAILLMLAGMAERQIKPDTQTAAHGK